MFDYDKISKKLRKFEDLSNKKQSKLLTEIFCSTSFTDWFYGVGDDAKTQPMTQPMAENIFGRLSSPNVMKRLTKFINNMTFEEFDHSACNLAFLVVEKALNDLKGASEDMKTDYDAGQMTLNEAKNYKSKSSAYNEYIRNLADAIKEKAKGEVKSISKKSNLPRGLIYTAYFTIPDKKYIPKYKISGHCGNVLKEVYGYIGANGLDTNIKDVNWNAFFSPLFGADMIPNVALGILLEGVNRIDEYRSLDYFEDVRLVWDSLTSYALTSLDSASDEVRKQMVEIYMKRVNNLSRNGNIPRLRIDISNVPGTFRNLSNTINRYLNRRNNNSDNNQNRFDNRNNQNNNNNRQNRNNNNENLKVSIPRDDPKETKDEKPPFEPSAFDDDFKSEDDDE